MSDTDDRIDPEFDLKARAAWHYYIEGLTQEKISEILGVPRIKVQRILSAARDEGIVQFKIRSGIAECAELQAELVRKFGLEEAIVVPSPSDQRNAPEMIGHAAGQYLDACVGIGDVIAVGWGRTIKAAINKVPHRSVARLSVVSLLGGVTHSTAFNSAGAAVELAGRLGADCHVLPVPVFADNPQDRRVFMEQRSIKDVLQWARRANLALISVGSFSRENPIADSGFIRTSEWEELETAGAVGDILGHFIDAHGELVKHSVNERACSLPISDLAQIPRIVLASGGREKIAALNAALKFMRVTTFITDEVAARGLLNG